MRKIQKSLVVLVLCVLALPASANYCKIQQKFSPEQWYNVARAYYYGEPDGYGLTLAAITIKESQAGLYKINPDSEDYGITQVNIKTALKRLGYKDTHFLRSVVAQRLVDDDQLSLRLSLQELLYWDRVHHSDWQEVVESYNAGNNWQRGFKYYTRIASIVLKLKQCF